MRGPGYAKAISWLSSIWESLDPVIIVQGFSLCGLTSIYDMNPYLDNLYNGTLLQDMVEEDGENFFDPIDCLDNPMNEEEEEENDEQ